MEPRASVNRNHVASEPNGDHGTDSASSLASFTWVLIKDHPSIYMSYEYNSLFSSHGGQAEILFGLNYSPLTGKLLHKHHTGTKVFPRTIIGWIVEGITLQKSYNTKGARYFCHIDFTWWQLQGYFTLISPQSNPKVTLNFARISPSLILSILSPRWTSQSYPKFQPNLTLWSILPVFTLSHPYDFTPRWTSQARP